MKFKSYKARRVTRAAVSGVVTVFSDLFNVVITLAKELSAMTSRTVPVQLLTDSKSLFGVISKGSRTSEKRPMLDIAAVREVFKDKTISDTGFARTTRKIADRLAKSMSQGLLRQVIASGFLHVKPEQCIARSSNLFL